VTEDANTAMLDANETVADETATAISITPPRDIEARQPPPPRDSLPREPAMPAPVSQVPHSRPHPAEYELRLSRKSRLTGNTW
jgi:hypothetical protein